MANKLFSRSVVIAVGNPKGGVTKTTDCINLAIYLHQQGLNVAVLDGEELGGIRTFEYSGIQYPECRFQIMDGFHTDIVKNMPMYKMAFDVILIDTAGITPTLSVAGGNSMSQQERVCFQAISLADFLLVPVNPSPIDVRKTDDFAVTVEKWHLMRGGALKAAMVLTKYKVGSELERLTVDALADRWDFMPLMQSKIRDAEIVKKAFGAGLAVFEFDPKHKVSQEMLAFCEESVAMLQAHVGVGV